MGETTPGIEFSESERPAVGQLPAPYLPAARFDNHKRSNVVMSAGTPVGLDTAGKLIPAGTPGGHVFQYTALDFTTGLPASRLAATGAAVSAAANSTMHSTLTEGVGKFVRPIGVVSYNVFQFEGGVTVGSWPAYTLTYDNPVNFGVHNTMAQDMVAVTCDYVLQVPYVYGKNLLSAGVKATDNADNEVALLSATAKSFPFAHDELIAIQTITAGATGVSGVASTGISGALINAEIIFVSPACGGGDNGIAVDVTTNCLIFSSGALGLALKVGSAGSAGTGINHSVLSTKGNTSVLYDGTSSEKYVIVRNTNGGTFVMQGSPVFQLAIGNQIKPGDNVVCRLGKFVRFESSRHDVDEIVGQCLRVDKSPANKDYLANVKTAYERSAVVGHRMAGSATRGVPQLVHLVTDGAQVISETSKQLNGTALTSAAAAPPIALAVINMLR
jgi:hypothetical protein